MVFILHKMRGAKFTESLFSWYTMTLALGCYWQDIRSLDKPPRLTALAVCDFMLVCRSLFLCDFVCVICGWSGIVQFFYK